MIAWALKNWRIVAASICVLVFVGMAALIHIQSVEKDGLKLSADAATKERDEARTIFTNFTTATKLFDDIARAARDGKKQLQSESEKRQGTIKASLAGNSCAGQLVPRDGADTLRMHADQIRSGAASKDTK